MAEEVGAIRYTTEVDTSDTLTAEKQLDKTTNAMVKDFSKVDAASKKLDTRMTKTAKSVKTGMASMGRSSGQAGIQFQQFIGQVQGGQNVMVALSQQSADLGFVLGAPLLGAVVGITASVIGMAAAFLMTGKATKDFTFDVNEASESLEKLNDLSKAQVSVAIKKTGESMDSLSKEADKAGDTIAAINQKLDAGTKANIRFGKAGSAVIENIKLTKEETKKLTEELATEQANLDVISQKYKEQSDLLVKLTSNKDGFSKKTNEQKDTIDKLVKSLEAQTIALEDGEEAAFRFATAQQLGLKVGEMLPANIDKQIDALFRLKEAQKQTKQDEVKEKQAGTFAAGVTKRGLSPSERLQADMDKLIDLREQELIGLQAFEAAKTSIEQQQSDLRKKIHEDEAKSTAAAQQAVMGAVLGAISATTSAMLAGMDEQSGAYKALFAIQKATQIAMTIANAEAAAAAVTAREAPLLGLGAVAAGNLVRGLGYASAGIIAGTAIAGGRQFGGPVNAGSAYRIGEAGPEIFTSGGKNFMIPGENGKVIANDDIGGGGFTQNVEIINNTPANVSTQTSDDGKQMRIVINEVARQVSNNQGVIPRALRSSTDIKFKATS